MTHQRFESCSKVAVHQRYEDGLVERFDLMTQLKKNELYFALVELALYFSARKIAVSWNLFSILYIVLAIDASKFIIIVIITIVLL